MKSQHPAGALECVRVVDMTGVGMAPMDTQMLADMGADVIKVESPGGDDIFRHVHPQRHPAMNPSSTATSAAWCSTPSARKNATPCKR